MFFYNVLNELHIEDLDPKEEVQILVVYSISKWLPWTFLRKVIERKNGQLKKCGTALKDPDSRVAP